jgi:hypothetical protein
MVLVVVAFAPQCKRTKSPSLSEIARSEGVRVEANALLLRAGKGATLVAEQLALE